MRPNRANIYRLMKAMIQSNYRPSKSALLKRAEVSHTRGRLTDTQYAEIIELINQIQEKEEKDETVTE